MLQKLFYSLDSEAFAAVVIVGGAALLILCDILQRPAYPTADETERAFAKQPGE